MAELLSIEETTTETEPPDSFQIADGNSPISPLPWNVLTQLGPNDQPEVDIKDFHSSEMGGNGEQVTWIPNFGEEDFQSRRNVFVGIHVPHSSHRHRKHKHKKRRAKEKVTADGTVGAVGGDRTPPNLDASGGLEFTVPVGEAPKTPADPCDRVKFILGGDEVEAGGCESHEVFTELEELCTLHGQPMWKEKARWLKFEEDVEEEGDKWSKPHVATLSLHSLFELRSNLLHGTVLLNVDAGTLPHIADVVLDNMVSTDQLEEEAKEKVREALLTPYHHHQDLKGSEILRQLKNLTEIKRTMSHPRKLEDSRDSLEGGDHLSSSNLPFSFKDRSLSLVSNLNARLPWGSSRGSPQNSRSELHTPPDVSITGADGEEVQYKHPKSKLLRKIPPGTEASNVLVGEVDYLVKPMIAFVRLSNAVLLGDLTEVPIPTRFLFILLGPVGNRSRFHEVGRSISTLMADEVFRDVAYKARNRGDLVAGVDEFLDKVTVLPPGEWDPSIRIEPPPSVPSQEARKKSSVALGSGGAGGGSGGLLPSGASVAVERGGDRERSEGSGVELSEDSSGDSVPCAKRPFVGVWWDMKRRYSQYTSDLLDVVQLPNLSSVFSSVVFMFIVSFSMAYFFGEVYGQRTGNLLGPVEMLLACGVANVAFSVFSGQPLIILGATFPLLMFETITFQVCQIYSIPFLQFRFWIGIWVSVLCMVLVATNSSYFVRFLTRFVRESFSIAVSLIFIFKAFEGIWLINWESPFSPWILYPVLERDCVCQWTDANGQNVSRPYLQVFSDPNNLTNRNGRYYTCAESSPPGKPRGQCPESYRENEFVWALVLCLGTYLVVRAIRTVRKSPYFMAWMRAVISDFAILPSVVLWMLVNFLSRIDVKSVEISDVFTHGFLPTACAGLGPNCTNRGWLVNPLATPDGDRISVGEVFAAAVPGILLACLIFTNHHLTAAIVNSRDNQLKKGSGYHLDFLVVSGLVLLFSLLGLPWMVGSAAKSIVHVQGLSLHSRGGAAGGSQLKFKGIVEQRLSSFAAGVLVAVSVIAGRGLEFVPVPVLYGIILLVGVSSLNKLQVIDRVSLLFMPDKNKPDYTYVRLIPNRRVYFFTVVQVIGIVVMVAILATEAAILFPILILALVVVRWIVGFVMTKNNVKLLDDALPSWMYRKPWFLQKCLDRKKKSVSVEMGELMLYEQEPYIRPNTGMSVTTSTPDGLSLNGRCSASSERKCTSDINISEELNNCSLFQHVDHMCTKLATNGKGKPNGMPFPDKCRKKLNLENIAECPESPDKNMAFV